MAVSFSRGVILYTEAYSREPQVQRSANRPTERDASPTRLTVRAFTAALLACTRVSQNPIRRNEAIPIPSHNYNGIRSLFTFQFCTSYYHAYMNLQCF